MPWQVGDPKANLVIMGDFNEGQPVGSEGQALSVLLLAWRWEVIGGGLLFSFVSVNAYLDKMQHGPFMASAKCLDISHSWPGASGPASASRRRGRRQRTRSWAPLQMARLGARSDAPAILSRPAGAGWVSVRPEVSVLLLKQARRAQTAETEAAAS